jgi:hypothetical protein
MTETPVPAERKNPVQRWWFRYSGQTERQAASSGRSLWCGTVGNQ